MKLKKALSCASIAVFLTLAPATPAFAQESESTSICDVDPNISYYAWFAWTFGYCN